MTTDLTYYYTSFLGGTEQERQIKWLLKNFHFHPEVFKKARKEGKAKGVDIALTKDLLSHAFLDNYDVAVLVSGDGDYVPVLKELKRLGKIIITAFFLTKGSGCSEALIMESDEFIPIDGTFIKRWTNLINTPDQ